MKLKSALEIARRTVSILEPYCERIEIAGSIRREKSEVKDIEIVCVRRNGRCLFQFSNQVNKWAKIKGDPWGRYTQRRLPEGIKLDLFMTDLQNWGMILAIRTGSASFSKKLAAAWVKKGYVSRGGQLYKQDGLGNLFPKPVSFKEESDLFEFLGMNFVEPQKRS